MTTPTVNSLIPKCFSRLLLALALSASACEALAEVVLTPLPGSTPQTTRPYAGTPVAIGVRATEDGFPVSGLPVTFEPAGSFVVSASSSRITVKTDASGIATLPAPGLAAGPTAGTYHWLANADAASARFELTVEGGFPFRTSVAQGASGDGQGVFAGQRLALPLTARVVGSDGLPVPYALVEFCFPDPSTPSVSVPGTSVYYVAADANGVATSPVLTANSVIGTNQVMAATPNTLELAPAERRAYFDFSIHGLAAMPPTLMSVTPVSAPTVKAQGLWWNPRENGSGLSLVAHGDTLFAALYTYDQDGEPTWVVMPGGSWDPTFTTYSGSLYRSTGRPFYDYDAASFAAGPAGNITITFQDNDHAAIEYEINGVSGFKLVERFSFDNGLATQPDHSDLYWGGPSQNGWGMTVMQQGSTLFVLWYTYDADGAPVWYAMPGGSWTANDTYEGHIYRTHSSPWLGTSYDASKFEAIDVGSFRIQFSGGTANFTYTADGHSGTMQLVREPF